MHKKYKVPLALGDKAHFNIKGAVASAGYLQLTRLDMKAGVLSWEMRSRSGAVVAGNATAEQPNPLLSGEHFIVPSMPITLHVRNGACAMDFIFLLPGAAFINVERANSAY